MSDLSFSLRPEAEDTVASLLERSAQGQAALLAGDAQRYFELVPPADDFTLMAPFGGEPSRGTYTPERVDAIGRFFRNGRITQELVHGSATSEMAVLAVIERAHVEVGGLPAQDWALRVTLVYRREADGWRLLHRHADPLAHGITLEAAAALGRG